jgi:hypothetical protein
MEVRIVRITQIGTDFCKKIRTNLCNPYNLYFHCITICKQVYLSQETPRILPQITQNSANSEKNGVIWEKLAKFRMPFE